MKIDTLAKDYISNNEIFADIVNYYLFDGESKIKASDLKELDTTEALTLKNDLSIQRFRDLLKEVCVKKDQNNTYIIFGIENQSKVDNKMALRCMLYDTLSYLKQFDNIEKNNKNGKIKLKSVITLVLYLGPRKWSGPKSLFEMLDMNLYQHIKDRIYDYKLNLISPFDIKDEEFNKFKSEIRLILKCIKNATDSKKLEKIITSDNDYKKVSYKAVELINATTKTKIEIEETEGDVNMCKAIDDMKKAAKREGKREEKYENAVNLYINGASLELISKSLKMTKKELKDLLIQNNIELRTA